jgi:hypothetical protein
MTTTEIISELNYLTVDSSQDYAQLDRLDELTAGLGQNADGLLACEALLQVLERHPQVEFGAPGSVVHALENYPGQYTELLLASLARRPTPTTIWMLNRLLNAATKAEKQRLLPHLKRLRQHPLADEPARGAAEEFYRFQTRT